MAVAGARKVELKRWQREIALLLEDFPRQYAALESAMAAFGGDFDLRQFKQAFDTTQDMDAYNRVQAVERALGRVQNFVADLAVTGMKLAHLTPPDGSRGGDAQRAFEALRAAGVIPAALCRRVIRAQHVRSTIEHSYIDASAGDVHAAAELVHGSARDFIGRYRPWIAAFIA